MERGLYQFELEPVNLLRIITRITDELQGLVHSKHIKLQVFLEGQPVNVAQTCIVAGEELLCYTLFSNLIKNALEASPEGECVTVHLDHHEKNMAHIRIHNKGVVPESIRERFFEKYVTVGKTGGTGLGTYSAKLIAEIQRGSIMMTSSEEEGTTLMVRLPQCESDAVSSSIISSDHERLLQEDHVRYDVRTFSQSLSEFPDELIEQLRDAVENLHVPATRTLIESIRQQDTALAEWIAARVQEFRFDLLQALFESDKMDSSQNPE
jgi:hypothetical protein